MTTDTRYTPEKLQKASQAVFLAAEESVADELSAMLRQAARDARTLAALREWLSKARGGNSPSQIGYGVRLALAELDRLEREP